MTSSHVGNKNRKQFIYLLHCEVAVKIGKSYSPANRAYSIGTKLPFKTTKTEIFQVNNMAKAEKFFHERYKDKRMNGEWFNLKETDISKIKSIITLQFASSENGVESSQPKRIKPTSIMIDEDLKAKAKALAAANKMTFEALVEDALTEKLTKKGKDKK